MMDFESRVIHKVLEGLPPDFNRLSDQLKDLKVKDRVRESGSYRVEFDFVGEDKSLMSGPQANMEISDTCIRIAESEDVMSVDLMVLRGHIFCLKIYGNYNFKDDFSIKDIFWEIINVKEGKEDSVFDPNKRDLSRAFGYIPTYK